MTEELSVNEILHDPLIRQLLRADRISLPSFAVFLEDARRRQGAYLAHSSRASQAPNQAPSQAHSQASNPASPHAPAGATAFRQPARQTRCLEQAAS